MAHPTMLLAVANACHRDMDQSLRAEIMQRVVSKMKDPPRSFVAASVYDMGTVHFAMNAMDYLEAQLPIDRPIHGSDHEWGHATEYLRTFVILMFTCVLVYFTLLHMHT
jgi:hypothetical protein